MENVQYRLEMQHISKRFGGIQALNDVSVQVAPGEIHALIGENGAGKSTLIKILSGAYTRDSGTICIDGKQVNISSPLDAKMLGVSVIYQEFMLAPDLTVAENIFIDRLSGGKKFINWKKLRKDAKEILKDLGLEILSMKEAGVDADIVEDGMTFEENAEIKARAVARILTNDIVLADDSGLEIDYLDKAPGIYSARFAGEDTSYDIKNRILLDRLEGIPEEERTARFVCAVAAVFPDGTVSTVRKTIEGRIAQESAGSNGFGYDPIFYVPEYGCTTAEMTPDQKNELSHRGKALRAMRDILKEKMSEGI